MIPRFADHAANERTFLAWVRTGIATIAFGLVIDKFNRLASKMMDASPRMRPDPSQYSSWLAEHDAPALVCIGAALLVVAAARFVRIGKLIDDDATHTVGVRAELILSLVLSIAVLAAYFAIIGQ